MKVLAILSSLTLGLMACQKDRSDELSSTAPQHQDDASAAETAARNNNNWETVGSGFNLLPTKNVLPITIESFCKGVVNVLAPPTFKQDIKPEMASLCLNGVPTALLTKIVTTPYAGTGTIPTFITESVTAPAAGQVQLTMTYALRLPRTPVEILIAEEPLILLSGYEVKNGNAIDLKMGFKFGPVPVNTGDSDTSFTVEQTSQRTNTPAAFNDVSQHDLKLYRMHPNNFDFMMAARTMQKPSAQFARSVVLVGVMPDPANPKMSISFSQMNFVMNDLGQNANNIADIFRPFVYDHIGILYRYHTTPPK